MNIYMAEALKEAEQAALMGEVPIGAVIVRDGEIIARAHNLTETTPDPTAHAEINALRQASALLGGRRLIGCEMYVTLEPCPMCAGALVWSRIDKLYIGAEDPKAGACGSVMNIVENPRLNHRIQVVRGLEKEECARILRDFFKRLREENR